MAAVWKKIEKYNRNVDVIMSIQNNSLVPFSKVTIQFTEANSPTEGQGFVLTGVNQWTQRVPKGTNVFYKEEDGGIMTFWAREIEKLVNYDIPTKEETVHNLGSKTVNCPEGSYITIQNIGKSPIFYNLTGVGNFTLTENQAVSYTFSKDNVINIKGDGSGMVTYVVAQSPNVTMLSEETQKLLDEINAKIEGLIQNSATKQELDVVRRRTYFGNWSPFVDNSGQSATKLISPVFQKDVEFHSEFIADKDVVDVKLELSLTHKTGANNQTTENATLSFSVITQPKGDNLQVSNFYCDNHWFARAIQSIITYRDNTNGRFKFEIQLNEQMMSYTMVASVRHDLSKFVKAANLEFLSEKINTYLIDKDNDNIHFTDENFYLGILKSWQFSINPKAHKWNITSKTQTGNQRLIQSGTTNDLASFKYVENNSNDAVVTVSIPALLGANKVVGVNIKPKDTKNNVSVYLDLIVMSNGAQTKSNNGNNIDYVIPVYKHTILGFTYLSQVLDTVENAKANEFMLEVVYE